jgi:serine/threonine protein kinase
LSIALPPQSLILYSEVESIDAEKGGYTKAADLWSLGILTAALLTGSLMVPREELSQLSQVQIVERFFGTDSDSRAQWQNVPPRASAFLRGLLVVDPDKRLTATQALNHSWFKKPLSEAALLEERYERVIRFWRKRDDDEVIENLPSKVTASQEDQIVKSGPKFRRKIPDTTLSPYFGLDRHLLPKIPSKRKTILDTLNESGSPFLVPEQHRNNYRIANTAARRLSAVRVLTVEGSDLFGSARPSSPTSQGESELDEICLVPTSHLIPHSERISGLDMGDGVKFIALPAEATSLDSESGVAVEKHKRRRRGSEDPEERKLRDGVAKELPRYSTAKALKDAVDRKKGEMRDENQLESLATRRPVPTA